jgi:hypothetical protein
MVNHNKNSENISAPVKQSDIEIAMDFVNKYYCINDSIMAKFRRKAKERLVRQAKDAIHTIKNPVAKRLIRITIDNYDKSRLKL